MMHKHFLVFFLMFFFTQLQGAFEFDVKTRTKKLIPLATPSDERKSMAMGISMGLALGQVFESKILKQRDVESLHECQQLPEFHPNLDEEELSQQYVRYSRKRNRYYTAQQAHQDKLGRYCGQIIRCHSVEELILEFE